MKCRDDDEKCYCNLKLKCRKFKKSSTGSDVVVEESETGNVGDKSDSKTDSSPTLQKPLKTSIYRTLSEKKVNSFNQLLSKNGDVKYKKYMDRKMTNILQIVQ